MNQLIFGTNQQIRFATENDFYETLGFLSKSDGTTSLVWEHNETSGAWGSEGRIQCYKNIQKFPVALSAAFTAGVGNILYRINCNEYIEHISQHHAMVYGDTQNLVRVRSTVPPA
ncbi:MAG: hypothetical protein J0M37_11360 [Ignavibacteria bacterium]|nr:hypothetical protein [Ignavibacteria bacterium]